MSLTIPTAAEYRDALNRVAAEHARAERYRKLIGEHVKTRRDEGWTDTMIEAEFIANSLPYEGDGVQARRRAALDATEPVGAIVVQYPDHVIQRRRNDLIAEVYGTETGKESA